MKVKDARQVLLDQVQELEEQVTPQELLDAICVLMVIYSGHYGVEKPALLSAIDATWDMMGQFEEAVENAVFSSGVSGEA